jgi:hypothetical protein
VAGQLANSPGSTLPPSTPALCRMRPTSSGSSARVWIPDFRKPRHGSQCTEGRTPVHGVLVDLGLLVGEEFLRIPFLLHP